jgi:ribosomal protein S18 acetylase RimI-like enzyme
MAMGDESLEIRPITDNELDDLLEVYRQCEDFLSLGPAPKASRAMILKDIETSRNDRGVFCGVYVSDRDLIGIVDFTPGGFDGAAHIAFISLLMIVPRLRNRGIGTRIVELVENRIRTSGRVCEIRTAVQLNNPAALRFWQRNNYRIFGEPELRPDQTAVSYLRKEFNDMQQC